MSRAYASHFHPPMPTLMVVVRTEITHHPAVPAIVDTGADATLVPTTWLEEVGALESEQVRVRGPFGEVHRVQRYLVDLEVEGVRLPGVYVLGDDTGQEVILGRDALNKLSLWLDGPQQTVTLFDDATVTRLRPRQHP